MSPKTGLPRYVIRIRKASQFYYYFRFGGTRLPLPAPDEPGFHASYSGRLIEHGLLEKAAEPLPRHVTPQRVYFIEDEDAGSIKVGISKWPRKRLTELQVGSTSRLRLIAHVPGGRELERQLHERFADYRLGGEWFERHPNILAEIDRLSAHSVHGRFA